jgi:hypothetical protein
MLRNRLAILAAAFGLMAGGGCERPPSPVAPAEPPVLPVSKPVRPVKST